MKIRRAKLGIVILLSSICCGLLVSVGYKSFIVRKRWITSLELPGKNEESHDCIILVWTPWFDSFDSFWHGLEEPICLKQGDGDGEGDGEGDGGEGHQNEDPFGPTTKKCIFTQNRKYLNVSKVVIFHASDVKKYDMPKRNIRAKGSQAWILYSAESFVNVPWTLDREKTSIFDFSMTYRLDSDFPWTYFGGGDGGDSSYIDLFRASSVIPFQEKNQQVPVVWLASNCYAKNQRHLFVQELMKYIPIDSLGGCLNNNNNNNNNKNNVKNVNNNITISPITPITLIKPYLFYLALENSECKDYITEKLVNALKAGAIPIVSDLITGYDRFLPLSKFKIIINVHDFASIQDLANHLISISRNETLYQEYHKFRQESVARQFLTENRDFRMAIDSRYQLCRLGSLARSLMRSKDLGKTFSEYKSKGQSLDSNSCLKNGNIFFP